MMISWLFHDSENLLHVMASKLEVQLSSLLILYFVHSMLSTRLFLLVDRAPIEPVDCWVLPTMNFRGLQFMPWRAQCISSRLLALASYRLGLITKILILTTQPVCPVSLYRPGLYNLQLGAWRHLSMFLLRGSSPATNRISEPLRRRGTVRHKIQENSLVALQSLLQCNAYPARIRIFSLRYLHSYDVSEWTPEVSDQHLVI
jgi:hypothetical protein